MMTKNSENRIQLIDALRGFCLILMLAYHFAYDLVAFGFIPHWVLYNPLLNFLQPFVAGIFILLAGVSSCFSRSNIRRGLIALLAAVAVSAVTYYAGAFVRFGILHFLGSAMVIYGLSWKLWDKIPDKLAAVLYIVLFAAFYVITRRDYEGATYLFWLGFTDPSFSSADYFPILPWIFIFLLGTLAGKAVRDRRLPERFYTIKIPFLPVVGRYSLVIYLAHQPLLYGFTLLLSHLLT